MHLVEPQVFLIAETQTNTEQLKQYLSHIGASGWETDAPSDIEEIVEIMGRSCYKSFGVGLNPNITRVRKGNKSYIDNIISSQHGSVMSHTWVSFMFCDVSRIFSHELVRHSTGTAISQESLRYVRLDDIGLWIPPCFQDNKYAIDEHTLAWKDAEIHYNNLLLFAAKSEYIKQYPDRESEWDKTTLMKFWDKLPFEIKKQYTSAFRRVAPEGLATNIGWSCNMRALRHIIEMRTSKDAEEEVRTIFHKVGLLSKKKWPNLFSDYTINANNEWITEYRKV